MKNPIKYSIKTEIVPFLILFLTIALSFWAYPLLPDMVVSHWDFSGQANGWSSREFHVLLFPALLFGMYLMFNLMPKFDPRSERYQEFSGVYLIMRNFIMLILLVVFAAATLSNLGYAINIGATVSGAVGLLMILLGNYFGKLKRNYFVGIKTPWTLSSENVWNKTHRLGSRVFIIWGIGLVLAPWLAPTIAFIILFGGLITILIGLTLYSYLEYRKEKK